MPSATSSEIAPVGMTAISSSGPPAPRRMTEPLPNCRSICAIASSRACRRSLFASAMRISLNLLPIAHCSTSFSAFEHSRCRLAAASMSGHSDTARGLLGEPRSGQLGVTGAARGELAAYQPNAGDADPAELVRVCGPQGTCEGPVRPGPAHPAEGDVRGKWPRVAGEADRRERLVHAAGQLDHRARAFGHAGPDHPGTRDRRKGPEAPERRVED